MDEQAAGNNPDRSADAGVTRLSRDESVKKANELLNRLFSDTRHDILNQLTILLGYIELSKDIEKDPTLIEFLKREEDAAESIRRQISNTKDLKDVGTRPAEWQNVKQVVEQASGFNEGVKIKIEISVDPQLEVYADPFFWKVFSNLLENTHIHGKRASFIRISTQEPGDGLAVVVEDDGEGIPAADKERIFTRLWPGRKDLGLYFVTEVLALTGMTIAEKGEPGKGARFEILVAEGGYRVP
jgi:signal transduction histidine kinase